jgi:hypothetical protein
LYNNLKESSSFEEYTQELTIYHSFGEVGNNSVAQANAQMGRTDTVDLTIPEGFGTMLAAYNGNNDCRGSRGQGRFIPNPAFKILKDLSPETMEKFMQL